MKQYWMFILIALQDIVFCAVDGAFANNVSLDVIVSLNTFLIVEYFCLRPMQLGFYGYQAMQSNPKNCLMCSLIAGVIVGVLVASLSVPISYLFTLTDTQRQSVQEVLVLFGCFAPVQAVTRYIQHYCYYTDKSKLVLIADLVTYIQLILTDWWAVAVNAGTFGLHLSTELCWASCLVILLPASGILKETDKISLKTIRHCFWVGKDVCISQSIIRAASIFLTSQASTMGTVTYAIHSVALSITDLGECFRDATIDYSVVELRDYRSNLHEQSRRLLKKLYLPALLLPLVLDTVLIFFMHGKVSLNDTIYGVVMYSIPFLIYPFYDISAAAIRLSTVRSSAILMACITAIWRVPILYGLIQLFGATIPVFSAIFALDYLSRLIIYRIVLRKDKKQFMEETTHGKECM